MKCVYCGYDGRLYTLGNGYKKCPKCGRKFSPKKFEDQRKILEAFCEGLNALECSKKLGKSYITIQKRYKELRYKIVEYLDEKFEHKLKVNEYDEYIYLEKSKRKDKRYIFEAKNFLTFDYDEGLIYSIALPELSRFKDMLLEDEVDEAYYKEFSRYLKWHKLSKLKTKENNIQRFWSFFEEFVARYKGVEPRYFFLYLKEAEFRYNFSKKSQMQILLAV